jgi:hypothetical protein
MWIDHLLFWAALVWMLLLAALVFISVRALMKDEPPDQDSSSPQESPAPNHSSTSPPQPPRQ